MALATGTISNAGSLFYWPSGTAAYGCKVVDWPEIAGGERDTTAHNGVTGGVVFGERRFNNRVDAGDFTVLLLETNGLSTMYADQQAGTERTVNIKGLVRQFTFVGWIKSIKPEQADVDAPDTQKVLITVVPVGGITVAGV
jgi:hypothetical protein